MKIRHFGEIQGVRMADETLSRVFNISSQSKQKRRSKLREVDNDRQKCFTMYSLHVINNLVSKVLKTNSRPCLETESKLLVRAKRVN